jgi:hypothetical protein
MTSRSDIEVVRELAARVAEIAALPVQEETRALWRKLNALSPERPMVMIDQVCWNELEPVGGLSCVCCDPDCRWHEQQLRRVLFQWEHFPVDMVVEPFVLVRKAVSQTGFGVRVQEEVAVTDEANAVRGHHYENQFARDEDLEKVRMPVVSHDQAETQRRLGLAHELYDGLLEVRPWGKDPGCMSLWDPISTWMSVEDALFAMVDRPGFMHALVGRMTDGYLSMLDQLEEQGLLCGPQSLIHCTGAWSDELPAQGYDPDRPRTKDLWVAGLAQMLDTVSPAMFREFEVDHYRRIAERFALVYYGCCDALDDRMDEVRRLPNVRKVSMSPWADVRRGAQAVGGEMVFSRKPNPAFLAGTGFDADYVRADLSETRAACDEQGCPLEYILKDLSTVRYEPDRLFDWARVAMDVVRG